MADGARDLRTVAVDDLTPEEVTAIIHSHRKIRYGTACWPCRQRKVRCDNKQPCENCFKRDHPQLCSYKPNRQPNKCRKTDNDGVNPRSKKRGPQSDDEAADRPRRAPGQWPRAEDEETAEVARYLGQNSIPSLLRETHTPSELHQGAMPAIRQDISSILGLEYSAPYPLMSSRHIDKLTRDIASALPSDREVIKLFRTYKEIPHPFWGFVLDIEDFEAKLMVYLEDRARNSRQAEKTSKPVSATWLAILFAVLAVGSQYHDTPYHIRTKDSQRYMQIAFHFLRIGNFLMRPNFESIQGLLLVSFVLLNDMKAEASWALIGMTSRLAQSLGLHRALPAETASSDSSSKDMARRRLWWTCVWHDTLTSLSFDRPPVTNMASCSIPLSPTAMVDGWTYLEAMYHLCDIISHKLNPDAAAAATYPEILETCKRVESIRGKVRKQLQGREFAKTAIDRLQHYAIRLHTSFVMSVCCRPALRHGRDKDGSNDSRRFDAAQRAELVELCKRNLTETVRMFLAMHQLSVIPTRSWAFTYHGLSSAVLLGLLPETKDDPEVRQLQGDLISALSASAQKEAAPSANDVTVHGSQQPQEKQRQQQQEQDDEHIVKTDRDIELSGPLHRALTALRNIMENGTVKGSSAVTAVPSGAIKSEPSNAPNLGSSSDGGGGGGNSMRVSSTAGGGGGSGPAPASSAGSSVPQAPVGLKTLSHAAAAMGSGYQPAGRLEKQGDEGGWSVPSGMGYGTSETPVSGEIGMQGYDNVSYNAIQQAALPTADLASLDGSMAPMDLYDSIFWEVPDPFNPGMDTMNFSFIAQPPPGQPQQQQFYF